MARGVLELLWEACYESGDEYLGTAEDIENLIGWTGEPGTVTKALADAGLPEGHGFIEAITNGDEPDRRAITRYRVHDLWHHAPDYVMKRHKRELERQQRVAPKAQKRRAAPNGGQRTPSPDRQIEVDDTPAPAPAPAPAHALKNVSVAPAIADASPALVTFPTVGTGSKTWDFTEAYRADLQQAYPAIDVLAEVRKARAWIQANQAKTAKGMPAFLVNWLNRATQRGGGSLPLVSTGSGSTVRTEYSPAVLKRIQQAGGR